MTCQVKSPFGYTHCTRKIYPHPDFLWHADINRRYWSGDGESRQGWISIIQPGSLEIYAMEIPNDMEETLGTLLYWMTEREQIRIRKEIFGRCQPWTLDSILSEWRFCNVDRQNDRVTRWITDNIIMPYYDSPTLWFNLVIARLVNWPPTLAKFEHYRNWNSYSRFEFANTINAIRGKAWTGAYVIPGGPSGTSKAHFLAEQTLTWLWYSRQDGHTYNLNPCEAWASWLGRAPALGPFLVNQIITDLKRTPVLKDASDWSTFVLAGPGTMRGLNRVLGLPLSKKWAQTDARAQLLKLQEQILGVAPQWTETLRDLNNLANCLCEFDKYMRVKLDEGKPRSRYITTRE